MQILKTIISFRKDSPYFFVFRFFWNLCLFCSSIYPARCGAHEQKRLFFRIVWSLGTRPPLWRLHLHLHHHHAQSCSHCILLSSKHCECLPVLHSHSKVDSPRCHGDHSNHGLTVPFHPPNLCHFHQRKDFVQWILMQYKKSLQSCQGRKWGPIEHTWLEQSLWTLGVGVFIVIPILFFLLKSREFIQNQRLPLRKGRSFSPLLFHILHAHLQNILFGRDFPYPRQWRHGHMRGECWSWWWPHYLWWGPSHIRNLGKHC